MLDGREHMFRGKSLLLYPKSELDDAWERVLSLLVKDQFPESICSAKVSTNKPNSNAVNPDVGVIVIYDSGSEADVKQGGAKIAHLMKYSSPCARLYFKENNQTKANEYATKQIKSSSLCVCVPRRLTPIVMEEDWRGEWRKSDSCDVCENTRDSNRLHRLLLIGCTIAVLIMRKRYTCFLSTNTTSSWGRSRTAVEALRK